MNLRDTLPFIFQFGVLLKTQLTNKHFCKAIEHSMKLVSSQPIARA